MIFGFGIYELFISKIDIAREDEDVTILEIKDLDELKNSPEEQSIESKPSEESTEAQKEDVSLDNLKDEEIANEDQKDSESTNS